MTPDEAASSESPAKRAGLALVWVLGASAIHLLAWSVVLGYFYFYVPRQMAVFNDFGVELPDSALLVIMLSDLTVNFWYLAFPAVVLCVVLTNATIVALLRSRVWRLSIVVLLLIPPIAWLINCYLSLQAPLDRMMQELH